MPFKDNSEANVDQSYIMKNLYTKYVMTSFTFCVFLSEVFAHNKKPSHAHPHENNNGNGNNDAPEIDGDEIFLFISTLILIYLMFFYWKKSLDKKLV